MKLLFCTVARKEQMAHAAVWAQWIKYYHPDSTLVLGMLEHTAPPGQLARFDEAVFLSNHGIPADPAESACAAKTALISRLLHRTPHDILVYLDPETRLYTPLEELHQLLQSHSIVAVPYLLEPSCDPSKEAERIHKGLLNAGFIGMRNTPEVRSFADWWAHVVHESFYGPNRDPYADHRWLDATMDIHGIHILKDPAYGLSAWNLAEPSRRIVLGRDGVKLGDGRWLRSMNFSSPDGQLDREILQLESARRGSLQVLVKAYRQEVRDALRKRGPLRAVAPRRKKKKPLVKGVTKALKRALKVRRKLPGGKLKRRNTA